MAIRQVQARFTVGELDPLLHARYDTEFYFSGAKTMRDILCLPEGGWKRRAGTLYIDRLHRQITRDTTPIITAPNGGTGANANDNNPLTLLTTTTDVGVIDPYVVVHYDLGVEKDIAVIDVVSASLTTAANATEFFVQVSNDDILWTTVGSAIRMSSDAVTKRVRVRGSYRYARFVRIGGTDLGTDKVNVEEFNVWIESADTSLAKRIDFKFNIDQTYIIFLTDKNISVYRNGVFQADVRANAYEQANIQTVYSTQTADTAILFQENIEPHELKRIDDATWTFGPANFTNITFYNFVSVETNPLGSITPSALDGLVTLTASVGFFTLASVGQYIEGNGGRARITAFTSATVVTALMEIPFYTTTAIATGLWSYETGWEAAWSDTRGWPRSGVFFQQRLWVGGSLSRPRTIWASRIGEFFDFDIAAGRDADAFEYDLDEDDPIVSLMSNRSLQIFTIGGEAAIVQSRTVPITPVNPSIVSQTNVGSEPGIKPVIVDGATLFLKNGGHSIGKFLFAESEQAYDTTNISLLSSHLIKSPVDMTVRKVTNDEEASYLMIVNGDGTLTFGCMLEEQNVKGFTQATTDGLFKNVAVDKTTMYAVIERTIDGIANNYLEQFDFDTYTDSAVQYTTGLPRATFTGLDHLEGKVCRVKVDGNILQDVTVVEGTVTIERDADTICEIGLDLKPFYESLPYENPEIVGPAMDREKHLSRVYVRVYNTSQIKINGTSPSLYGLELSNPLDAVNPIYSGVLDTTANDGWDKNGTVTITQDDPLPLTVLAVETKVNIS